MYVYVYVYIYIYIYVYLSLSIYIYIYIIVICIHMWRYVHLRPAGRQAREGARGLWTNTSGSILADCAFGRESKRWTGQQRTTLPSLLRCFVLKGSCYVSRGLAIQRQKRLSRPRFGVFKYRIPMCVTSQRGRRRGGLAGRQGWVVLAGGRAGG